MTSDVDVAQIRVVAVGNVDHGKSTLIGRLLHDTGNLPNGKVAELRAIHERRGVAFEWSFVLDALQSERDQAITIDTTRVWLRVPGREIVLIDAPGHLQFLRNMVTGASDADAALLVVDAFEGVGDQTRRHAVLLELIGIKQVVVALNKMDRVGYSAERYENVRAEIATLLDRIGITSSTFVPTAALEGENVANERSANMDWYTGPTVLQALLSLSGSKSRESQPLRISVQGIVRRGLRRNIVGRIDSGILEVGQQVAIFPGRRVARVSSIETWPRADLAYARAGESIGLVLDEALFVDRGDVISDTDEAPTVGTSFRARLLWLGRKPMARGDQFRVRLGTRVATVQAAAIERVVHGELLEYVDCNDESVVHANDVAEVVFKSREVLAIDDARSHAGLGRFILLSDLEVVAGGTILGPVGGSEAALAHNLVPVDHHVDEKARAWRNGYRGAVIWLTGLPASGKSTIAMNVERRLFEKGYSTYVLDGDNVRSGLCKDLGFSHEDRRENVRRVAEVGALFAEAGTILIAALVSPYRADRDAARSTIGDAFHEIYVRADPALCEERDPKGHYRLARAGMMTDFTGISGEYEVPRNPELVVDTGILSLADSVSAVVRYIEQQLVQVHGNGHAVDAVRNA